MPWRLHEQQVRTYKCIHEDDRRYVLEHLGELVVKAVDEAGGYGMLMGPQSTRSDNEEFRKRTLAEPRKYIAQHRVELSTCPTWDPDHNNLGARRIDLKPFILTGAVKSVLGSKSWVLPGGLTRVTISQSKGFFREESGQDQTSPGIWSLGGRTSKRGHGVFFRKTGEFAKKGEACPCKTLRP